ncbi:MAG: hypothetical protein ACYDDI_14635 [Candidatus Acidiferrales bacterium]
MRIGVVIFTALTVSLISAPSPSPSDQKSPSPAQSKTQTNTQPSKSSKKSLAPPAYSPSKEKPSANTTDQKGKAVTPTPNERAIRIVSYPPRSAGETVALVCTIVLTLVGIGGIIAAFCTLRTIQKQTDAVVRDADATQEAARATQASVELQKTAMEQWVDTEKWETEYLFTQDGTEILPIRFRIRNPTKFKITLLKAVCWINGRHIVSIHFRKQLLAPDGYAVAEIKYPLNAGQVAAYRGETLKFEAGGVIYFVDAFRRQQEQSFGYACWCRSPDKSFFEPVSFVAPSDTENKAERKAT